MTWSENAIPDDLPGRNITPSEERGLRDRFGRGIPEWLIGVFRTKNLVGIICEIQRQHDPTGLGVDLRWMDPQGMILESFEAYPGIAALQKGYIPIGDCLIGSGDPYFVDVTGSANPPLVRIRHDELTEDQELSPRSVEQVCESLTRLFEIAMISS
jgi:hypothetical protein